LSDHGQCLATPFSERYGELLEDTARRLMGVESRPASVPVRGGEYHGVHHVILGEVGRGRGPIRAIARRAATRRKAPATALADDEALVACASGNLALLYLTASDDRLDRAAIEARYPALIDGLVGHPGVGVVVVDSGTNGPVAIGRSGAHYLASGRIEGEDPLARYGPTAAESHRRLD